MHDMDHEVGKSYRFFPTSALSHSTSSERKVYGLFLASEFWAGEARHTSGLLSPARH